MFRRTLSASLLKALGLTGPALAYPILLRFSHVVAENTPKDLGAFRFEELAEAYINGAVEVQPHATLSYHGNLGYAVIFNSAFWEALPPEIRSDLVRALDEATDYANSIATAKNAEAITLIAKAGTTELHELTLAERAAWLATLLPVHDRMRPWLGDNLVDLVQSTLGLPARASP